MNPTGSFNTVHHRHAYIEDDEVGLQFDGFIDSLLPIFGLAADFPVCRAIEQIPNAATNHFVVVDQENFECQIAPSRVSTPSDNLSTKQPRRYTFFAVFCRGD